MGAWFIQGARILMKAIAHFNYPQILQPLVTNLKMSLATDLEPMTSTLWRVFLSLQTCTRMRSLLMIMMTNTSQCVMVIQESNELVSMLYFSMTMNLMLPIGFI